MQPVNRLPPEILSYIARGVCNKYHEDARTIIPLTHVCRYWRVSIISTPENWAVISNHPNNIAALSLERAKAAPLEIYLDMDRRRQDPEFLDPFIPHFRNAETMRITSLSTIEDLSFVSQHTMANLRSLALLDRGHLNWDRSIDPFEPLTYTLRYLELFAIPLYPSFLNLTTLTGLDLRDFRCSIHLDTFLDFLERNHSLTSARLHIWFIEPFLRSSRRRAPIQNRLQYLRIVCGDVMDGQALISGIALSKGAELEFNCWCNDGVNDVLSVIPTTHLSNLPSPTFMRYRVCPRFIKLHGPNGAASFYSSPGPNIPFAEFPRIPLASIRRFHLDACGWDSIQSSPGSVTFHLSPFTALETFIAYHTDLSYLSALLENPSASPSLKTFAFLNCFLSEEFMEALTRFASDRKNTTSTRLQCVVIIHQSKMFPSIASIRTLERHVPLVDVRIATELPRDL